MKTNTDFQASLDIFVEHFFKEEPFPSDNWSISYWEDVIYKWLNGLYYDDEELLLSMKALHQVFVAHFPYTGEVYRGTQLPIEQEMTPRNLASFSSYDEVALFFAGDSEVYGENFRDGRPNRTIISTRHAQAFHFVHFLEKLKPLTSHFPLLIQIDDRTWESEVLAPLTEEMIQSAQPVTKIKEES